MKANMDYAVIPSSPVLEALRWDVPRENQGQMVEVAYAEPGCRSESGPGDLYQRTIDASDRSVTYAKRVGPRWV